MLPGDFLDRYLPSNSNQAPEPTKEDLGERLNTVPSKLETHIYKPFVMLAFDLTRKRLVFLKDYWRANVDGMEKEGEIYRFLQANDVPHIAPFGMENDVRNQETHTQRLINLKPPMSWLHPTTRQICLRNNRMTLDVVGRNITEFESSRQFISAIADAMEAHDGAFFDCKVLHHDISVGNIILTDDNRGQLIDWDLCTKSDDDNDKPIARRHTRTGTWQFMSVKLLQHSSMRYCHHDDRESAFYVLLWTALRYTKTEAAPRLLYSPREALQAFDELRFAAGGREVGGDKKENLLEKYRKHGIVFTERPQLDSLMAELAPVFSVRYEPEPTAKQMAHLKKVLKKLEDSNSEDEKKYIQEGLDDSVSYRYQQRKDKLEKKGWLVDTIRKYLDIGSWPTDESCVQVIVKNRN